MKKQIDKRIKGKEYSFIPAAVRLKLSEKQINTILQYETLDKLQEVAGWRTACAEHGLAMQDVARGAKIKPERFSEYINYKVVPGEKIFARIVMVLYRLTKS